MTQTSNLSTLNDIKAALTAVGLPMPGVPALVGISKVWRDDFCLSLGECLAGKDQDGSRKKRLEGLISCLMPDVITGLHEIGYSHLEPEHLVKPALDKPTRLVSALSIAKDPKHERNAEAKAYLDGVFKTPEQARSDNPSVPEQPVGQPAPAAATEPPADAQPRQTTPAAQKGQIRSAHAYGANAALCFNAAFGTDGKPGIMVDAAASIGTRTYDWKNAIHLWLDAREVACVLAVFRRWRESVEFSAHGAQNDKSFLIQFQKKHFFCKVVAKKAPTPVRAVPVLPIDAHKIAVLFLEQLLLAYPNLPPGEVIALARSVNQVEAEQPA